MTTEFASDEARQFWGFIAGSLDRLVELVRTLPQAQLHWRPSAQGTNSIFVLAQHSIANAADNILATLGGQPGDRDRDAEFETVVARDALLQHWATLRPALAAQMASLTGDQLARTFDHPRRGALTGLGILIVVARHTAEHLGQAELTRDLAAAAELT